MTMPAKKAIVAKPGVGVRGKATAPGQMAKVTGLPAKGYAPGQANKVVKVTKKK